MLRTISIAAPAYNEASSIELLLASWVNFLSNYPGIESYEIVICNDGSTDSTGELLDQLAINIPQLKPVHFSKNQGAAAALTRAISCTSYEWVLLIDSDGQFPIENLTKLECGISHGAFAVIGARETKSDSFGARFGTWISGLFCNYLYGTSYKDFNSALKLISGDLLRSLVLEAKGLNYSTEITARVLELGIQFSEVPAEHLERRAGISNMKFIKGSAHRFLFIFYLAVRRFLLHLNVLHLTKFDPRK